MSEPWKKVFCWSSECQKLVFKEDGSVNTDMYLYPEVDKEGLIQFRCPRCGEVETWGPSRIEVARILHERCTNIREK